MHDDDLEDTEVGERRAPVVFPRHLSVPLAFQIPGAVR